MSKLYHAPAKVNLRLTVKSRRPDGYHEIESLMQAVTLRDSLLFTPIEEGIEVYADSKDVPNGESNIAWRAARLILDEAKYNRGVRIDIQKEIPVAAGLGGGSSNAATTLTALNEMFTLGFDQADLLRLGTQLGADVPFFLFRKSAWARGIGEILTPAGIIPQFNYLIINPLFPLSTAAVYRGVKIGLTNPTNDYSPPGHLADLHYLETLLVNDLESVSLAMHPKIGEIKQFLVNEGALGTLMSGSGPSVFGIFADREISLKLAQKVRKETKWLAFAVTGLNSW